LRSDEVPHALYIQNYSSAAATCILFKKWLFNLSKEIDLCDNDLFFGDICYWEAVNAVNSGQVNAGETLYQLKALQNANRKNDYLKMVRSLSGYGEIVFPHCACDARKEGHIIVSIGGLCFRFQACSSDGALEEQILEVPWPDILNYAIDGDGFVFEYARAGKKARTVKILTPFIHFMLDCFNRVKEDNSSDGGNDGKLNGCSANNKNAMTVNASAEL